MPLLRGIARTAVVAGTATAVSNRVSRRQAGRWARKDQSAYDQQSYDQQGYDQQGYDQPVQDQQAAVPQPRQAGTDTNTKLAQLRQLGELHNSGVLDDAEFELQKSQILNS